MKTTISLAALLGALLVGGVAAAQYLPYEAQGQSLDARIERVGGGIRLNESNGSLAPNIGDGALQDLDNIKATENIWRSKNGGSLTRQEWHILSRRLINLERRVHYSEVVNAPQ